MTGYLAAAAIVLLLGMVITRVMLLRRRGTNAMHFGNLDKTDFLIPPVALFYFYTVFAAAFRWPLVSSQLFYHSEIGAWVGVGLCFAGVLVLLASLVSLGRSFRVGIDVEHPGQLVTTGVFAISRNPIYVGFTLVLIGQFLVFPNWIPLVYLVAGVALSPSVARGKLHARPLRPAIRAVLHTSSTVSLKVRCNRSAPSSR